MRIAENVARVRAEIADAARAAGRSPEDITLVAAAKTHSADSVREAIAAGVDAVGENRAQEMTAKLAEDAYVGAPLHFIGHLQSNKIKNVVGACDLIESAGSLRTLELIGLRAQSLGIVQKVLIEVNIGKEINKSGVEPENLYITLENAGKIEGIAIHGLMAIPPVDTDYTNQMRYFDSMYKLFVDIRERLCNNDTMRYLSMGMSGSFVAATRSGANMVRVGSAIFGGRQGAI